LITYTLKTKIIVKIRLCIAIAEFDKIPEKKFAAEKKAKARKMVAVFIETGSLFSVKGLPAHLVEGLKEEKFELFMELHKYVFEEMIRTDAVREEAKKLLVAQNLASD
jgi:hypothetical protein